MEIRFHLLSLFTLLLFYFFTMNSIHVFCLFFLNFNSVLNLFLHRLSLFETKVLLYIFILFVINPLSLCYFSPKKFILFFFLVDFKMNPYVWTKDGLLSLYTNEISYLLEQVCFSFSSWLSLLFQGKRLWRWFTTVSYKFLAELNFYAQKYPRNQVSSIFPSNPIFVSRRHSFVFPFVSRYSRRATYRQHG
jgi:hypothetical protein